MANYITIEDAVARMVNVGKIEQGTTLLDHLEQITIDADAWVELDKNLDTPYEEYDFYELCAKGNKLKHQLAELILRHIKWELTTSPNISILKRQPNSSGTEKLEINSVAEWASTHYGIDRFDYEELNNESTELPITESERMATKIAEKKISLTSKVATRLYISLAYLLEEFIHAKQTNSKLFGTVENIKVDSVAELLRLRALSFKGAAPKKNPENEEYAQFYSKETFRSTIEIAIAMKKLFGKN